MQVEGEKGEVKEEKEEEGDIEVKEKTVEDENQVKMKFKKDAPGATGDQVPTLTK